MSRRKQMDYTLLLLTLVLVVLGLAMVYSASGIWAHQNLGNSNYFLKKQLAWAALGFSAMIILSRTNYNNFKEWMWPILTVTIVALIGALICPAIGGAHRWLRLGPLTLQPSEFAKLTSVLFLSYHLDRKKSKVESSWRAWVAPMVVLFLLLGLIGAEPDLGTPVLMFSVALLVLFVAGGRMQYIIGFILFVLPIVAVELWRKPYRRARVMSFLSPFDDATGKGYQLAQSLLAVGSGGWIGKGIGASKIKLMYLPTPYTDFIFPILCEELGFLGALACLSLFALFLIRGIRIARQAPNLFGSLLAAGITFTICLQAFFNIAMSVGILPTKGIPLPFISFGGSSLLATLCGVGILLNISRQAAAQKIFSTGAHA